MSENIIECEKISKLYRLGTLGSGSLRQDLSYWWSNSVLRKKDQRFFYSERENENSNLKNYLWALQDINFNIEEGEVLGIIGRNGAGKSTLLKILSRIIKPTEGSIRGRGKISSMLEVGTGFHSELTGRENIYLSGYMLGMKKGDIKTKFDEIIDFSGVEQFIDTPVKRYSSGMYVRLAFAVAAHLEPDILIVDEVLAVGDAEFQKKCMGKMKDVSTEKGRTIIFVSHNMQAVNTLCQKAIWLQKGRVVANDTTQVVVNKYLSAHQQKLWKQEWSGKDAPGNDLIKFLSVELIPHVTNPFDVIDIRTPITVRFRFENNTDQINLMAGLHLFTLGQECIFDVCTKPAVFNKTIIEGECLIPGNFLNDGSYYISIMIVKETSHSIFYFQECLFFDVEDHREEMSWYGKWMGYVRPQFPFTLETADTMIKLKS